MSTVWGDFPFCTYHPLQSEDELVPSASAMSADIIGLLICRSTYRNCALQNCPSQFTACTNSRDGKPSARQMLVPATNFTLTFEKRLRSKREAHPSESQGRKPRE